MFSTAQAALLPPARERFADMLQEMHPRSGPVGILLIEDTHSDIMLTRMALDAARIPYRLEVLKNGCDVLPYLTQRRAMLPDVILLDLGLPQVDGFEVLNELACAPSDLRAIPVIVITGYEDFEYMRNNGGMLIADYVVKPLEAGKLRETLSRIGTWRSDAMYGPVATGHDRHA